MNNLDQSIQSEFDQFKAQCQQQEMVINNPESKSFQDKSQQQQQNSSIQYQSDQQLQSYQQSVIQFQDQPQVEIFETSLNETEQYLNISFQDIIQLLFNNQCPQLINELKRVIQRSCIVLNVFTILNLIFLINEVVALYFSLITKDEIKELFGVYFGFNLISDCLMIYINCQLRYTINEAEQINNGDITHPIIEYLKYTISQNSPFSNIMGDDEQDLSAYQVASRISGSITTTKWISYLLESQNSQIFVLTRVCVLVKIILFAWGNITILQWGFLSWDNQMNSRDYYQSILIVLTLFSMLMGYIILILIISVLLIISAIIPILMWIAICQSCCWCTDLYDEYKQHRIEQQRQGFLSNLGSQKFQDLKEQDTNMHEECSICLQAYQIDDKCIKLPCNVDGGTKKINHIFHDECIRIWIQEQGSCPICRTIFIERLQN
ncbi:unnamed protein product (macronuclear) [Paramecium tetraurelia]|uniref:RING-type domain-containing protein n=1 Tax=Paramecium tetraurelia TaxID=5888 RepID=A0DCD0_PARTE|nr:uncharacterized protein GSPATT00015575001 [Paramecium tetraurelia]CAK80697.1 unnamed protein product [Paramecium tetraurelia]|eukprot:XP_001448094.1 hypothetical protein (macronuclear) [Paramecium tetraurelia strain d4-2]